MKWKRLLGFPFEDQDRAEIEQELSGYAAKIETPMALMIMAFEVFMMTVMGMREGGPFASTRRSSYFILYIVLFVITLLFKATSAIVRRRNPQRGDWRLRIWFVYSALISLWACAITLVDQLGGNGLNVFVYVVFSIAALSILKPWQSILIFGGSCAALNVFLPFFALDPGDFFNNLVNSLFVAVVAILISSIFYRNRVSNYMNQRIIREQVEEIRQMNDRLNALVVTDELTQVGNRRYLETHAQDQFSECVEAGQSIAAMMVDIDYFKQFNDVNGHPAGDRCLQRIADAIRSFEADRQICAVRYGGEEFFICFSGMDEGEAMRKARQLREIISRCEIIWGEEERRTVTVSVGVYVEQNLETASLEQCVLYADRALYQAKGKGRNCEELYRPGRSGDNETGKGGN